MAPSRDEGVLQTVCLKVFKHCQSHGPAERNRGIKNPYPLSSMPLLGCIRQRGQEDQPIPFTEASISQHRQSRKQQEMDLEGHEDNHRHNLSFSPFSKQFLLLSDVKLSAQGNSVSINHCILMECYPLNHTSTRNQNDNMMYIQSPSWKATGTEGKGDERKDKQTTPMLQTLLYKDPPSPS